MSNSEPNKKKIKRPKYKSSSTTRPASSKSKNAEGESSRNEPLCPLLAKDSEWADILQTPPASTARTKANACEEEEELQLVDCEEGPEMKPLAIMFPGLVKRDPQTLQGVINKVMSTTEVTKHLVDLGEKANFDSMKKTSRLIPKNKKWLEKVTETSNSFCSEESTSFSTDYDADNEISEYDVQGNKPKNIRKSFFYKESKDFKNHAETTDSD